MSLDEELLAEEELEDAVETELPGVEQEANATNAYKLAKYRIFLVIKGPFSFVYSCSFQRKGLCK